MTESKKLVLNAAGDAVTIAPATVTDVLTTAISVDSAVTGMYGLLQRGGLFLAGMATGSKVKTGEFKFWK